MGFWGDLLGIGGDIAGAAIGMPWLGSAATAAGNMITGSQAATSAAATQQAGAQQAAALQQPAMQIGQGALGRLGSLYGLAMGPGVGQAITTGIPATVAAMGFGGKPPSNGMQQGPDAPDVPVVPKFANGVDPNSLYGMAQPANASSYGA